LDNFRIDEDELLDLLQELIRIESVNPTLASDGSGEARIAKFIHSYLQKMGLETKKQEIAPNRVNVIGILRGSGGGKSLILNGHMDTVSLLGMEIDPLKAEYVDERVYGRGAIDMKSGLAAMIMAVKYLLQHQIKLAGDVILTFVADEEYASIGTEAIIKEYSADAAIVCEPTDLELVIAHKGFAWIKVDVLGKAAHGSLPSEGIDAIVKAGKFLAKLDQYESELAKKNHPLLGSPSIHASLINGGVELSTYPDHCKIELERRTIPGENQETVFEEMKSIINAVQSEDDQFNATFDVFFYRPALEGPKDSAIVKTVEKTRSKFLKRQTTFQGMSGWLDSALLAAAGIPTVIFGPSGAGAHGAVEYVELTSVVDTTKILVATIMDFCQ
jgi:acetylornithine deacetylase